VTIRELGHVALFVRDLDATRRFYRDILGSRRPGPARRAHRLLLRRRSSPRSVVRAGARRGVGAATQGVPGLYHIAFDVGAALDDLAVARRWAETHGLEPFGETPTSFSVRDPDGHEVELYVASAARSANAG